MTISNALAGIAVRDLAAAIDWYTALLGRAPDEQPMPEVAEWTFSGGGWIQVFTDAATAGSSSVTLVESDVALRIATLRDNGIPIVSESSSDLVAIAIIADPDGNRIVFAEARDPDNRAASATPHHAALR